MPSADHHSAPIRSNRFSREDVWLAFVIGLLTGVLSLAALLWIAR